MINLDSIEPIFESYFLFGEDAELDHEKVKLAKYCIRACFEYMRWHGHPTRRSI